jgi:transcriptional regulator with XRE-family HTH domain
MSSLLGAFLRARRQVTTVDQAGLPQVGDRRRTPGLRRDEVAMLAGMSVDYYTRLEQGRERSPSDQVLDALAQVFQLDSEATKHLYHIARPMMCKRLNTAGRAAQVSPNVLRFVEGCDHALAFVVNRRWDVLAENSPTAGLYAGLAYGDNLLRLQFLNPASREFYPDWEQEAWFKVAHLRAVTGPDCDDTSIRELVEELSAGSKEFRRIWARHDVQTKTNPSVRFQHRVVGGMTFQFELFDITSDPGQKLIVGQAEPGTPSELALAKLSTLNHERQSIQEDGPRAGTPSPRPNLPGPGG